MNGNEIDKLRIKNFDFSDFYFSGVVFYKTEPLIFNEGMLFAHRHICGNVHVNELKKFPFPICSTDNYMVHGTDSQPDNYCVIFSPRQNGLETYIRYLDPSNIFDGKVKRKQIMLEMQSVVEENQNYILTNNKNDRTCRETVFYFGEFYYRPKISNTFDIKWNSKGSTFEEILKEADKIVEDLELEIKKRLSP